MFIWFWDAFLFFLFISFFLLPPFLGGLSPAVLSILLQQYCQVPKHCLQPTIWLPRRVCRLPSGSGAAHPHLVLCRGTVCNLGFLNCAPSLVPKQFLMLVMVISRGALMVMQTHSCSGKNTRNLMEFTLCVSALKVAMFLNCPIPRRREILKLEDSGSPRLGHDLSFMVNMNL